MSQYKNIASINQNRLFAGITPDDLKISLKQGNFMFPCKSYHPFNRCTPYPSLGKIHDPK